MTAIDPQLTELLGLAGQMIRTRKTDILRKAKADGSLDATIKAWVQTRDLADSLKALKSEIDNLVTELRDEHVPWQIDLFNREHGLKEGAAIRHALGLIKINHHTKASINDGCKPDAFKWLRKHNLGGIIIETVPHQSLSATAKELIEQKSDLPSDLFFVTTHRYASFEKDTSNATLKTPRKNRLAKAGA
jgi:hypothetical protein